MFLKEGYGDTNVFDHGDMAIRSCTSIRSHNGPPTPTPDMLPFYSFPLPFLLHHPTICSLCLNCLGKNHFYFNS